MWWTQSQSPWFRFIVTGSLLSLTLITFLVFGIRESDDVVKYVVKTPIKQTPQECPPPAPLSSNNASWEFAVERDGNNHGLSDEQCHIAFPKLFVEIDKSASWRRENDKRITFKDLESRTVEDGMVRGMIVQGELYIIDFAKMPVTYSRAKATLNSLHRALMAFPERHNLPDIEFIFTSEDFSDGQGPVWSYSKRDEDESVWLMPDFGYWSWPEVMIGPYNSIRQRIAVIDEGETTPGGKSVPALRFQDKKKQLVWRGSIATNPEVRSKLLKSSLGNSWASIRVIDWDDENDLRYNLLPMEEHCRYMFLAHAEGRSFSGRGKYLLNCRSVVISHKLVWREAHHAALVSSGADANYVEVERDFSDLSRKMEFLIDNPETAERIANNAVKTFRDRYLTPAAESCYWRHLVRQYASVSDFEPVLYNTQPNGRKEMRGTPFESWVLTKS
ncbi:hypothetical protein ASPWEDRAFT_118903 [Aspergillus wentii DTO 134E9]|uniref:Glycosyl transferase CAP10 domain-containing protein n=1 Tax=Aspergillus wentii DTO 134E9 TaxID=1073089 RepID=A0A1L9R987_ASPWE|nr:uncharacterized protein ASPWEDRAFT_118903 [Aspergillus wentii DTO 134E9]KAI9926492.1 hypothetical protein MW887_004257 [Aspergillus wentii]OJJ31469.1 hypothetical protein ASPWEDRAFT_118903 [Aspergillus wentii DTO 134E9]